MGFLSDQEILAARLVAHNRERERCVADSVRAQLHFAKLSLIVDEHRDTAAPTALTPAHWNRLGWGLTFSILAVLAETLRCLHANFQRIPRYKRPFFGSKLRTSILNLVLTPAIRRSMNLRGLGRG